MICDKSQEQNSNKIHWICCNFATPEVANDTCKVHCIKITRRCFIYARTSHNDSGIDHGYKLRYSSFYAFFCVVGVHEEVTGRFAKFMYFDQIRAFIILDEVFAFSSSFVVAAANAAAAGSGSDWRWRLMLTRQPDTNNAKQNKYAAHNVGINKQHLTQIHRNSYKCKMNFWCVCVCEIGKKH